MSAHLTVYAMAIEAERPLRMREAEQASRFALAEASSGQRSDRLLGRLGMAIRRSRASGFTVRLLRQAPHLDVRPHVAPTQRPPEYVPRKWFGFGV